MPVVSYMPLHGELRGQWDIGISVHIFSKMNQERVSRLLDGNVLGRPRGVAGTEKAVLALIHIQLGKRRYGNQNYEQPTFFA
jgi:hypothetical protein